LTTTDSSSTRTVFDEKLIEYLSKEIETHTNSMVAFRARGHFSLFVGPFAILGALLVTDRAFVLPATADLSAIWPLIGLVAGYMGLGWMSFAIEEHVWNQCNRWRSLIADVRAGGAEAVTFDKLVFRHRLPRAYALSWLAMFFAFVSSLLVVARYTVIVNKP
jgi:hypothetical protein